MSCKCGDRGFLGISKDFYDLRKIREKKESRDRRNFRLGEE